MPSFPFFIKSVQYCWIVSVYERIAFSTNRATATANTPLDTENELNKLSGVTGRGSTCKYEGSSGVSDVIVAGVVTS